MTIQPDVMSGGQDSAYRYEGNAKSLPKGAILLWGKSHLTLLNVHAILFFGIGFHLPYKQKRTNHLRKVVSDK